MKELYTKDGLKVFLKKDADGKDVIEIETFENEVKVNNLSVFTPNPLKDFIPFYLQSFFRKNKENSSDIEYASSKKESVAIEVSKDGRDLSAGFMLKKDSVKVRFDWFSYDEDVKDFLEEELTAEEAEEVFSEISEIKQNAISQIRKLEFGWKFSHNFGSLCLAWYDLTFDEETWDEDNFDKAWEILDDSFKKMMSALQTYNLY